MRYADTLLAEGESITLRARQHWIALLIGARRVLAAWAVTLVAVVLLLAMNPSPGLLRDLLAYLALGTFGVGLVFFVYYAWEWRAQDYLVTNRRIIKVKGVLRKETVDSSLEKINDAELNQGLLGRLLGYGDLIINTASDIAVDRFHLLRDPIGFKRAMLEQKHRLELSLSGGDSPRQAAPAPGPAAPAPAPAAPDSADIARTVEQLRQLRDSGAITTEEYEAKKTELLGRL